MIPPNPQTTATPQLPKSPAGSPSTPGASPMTAPGGGEGNKAAAVAQLKAIIPTLYKIMAAFPPGSKENSAMLRAVTAMSPIAGKTEQNSLVPAAIQQMAAAAQSGGLKNAPPVGLAKAPLPDSGAGAEAA